MVEITTANYDAEVTNSDIPVVLKFWAEWCGFCKQITPAVEELARENEGKVKFGTLNIDEQMDIARKFRVMSIPVCIRLEHGEEKKRVLGAYTKEELAEQLGLTE